MYVVRHKSQELWRTNSPLPAWTTTIGRLSSAMFVDHSIFTPFNSPSLVANCCSSEKMTAR